MSLLVRTFRQLAGDRFALVQVELSRAAPEDSTPYARFFRCAVGFDARNALWFDDAMLDQPLLSGHASN